jgi:putative ABC transport system permease protein
LLAFVVTERTKEIGVRMALGARLAQVTWSVVREGMRLVVIGAAIGVVASLALLRTMSALLFGVQPNDVTTYAGVLLLLCSVAAVAAFVPARRAARIDPMVALRYE